MQKQGAGAVLFCGSGVPLMEVFEKRDLGMYALNRNIGQGLGPRGRAVRSFGFGTSYPGG